MGSEDLSQREEPLECIVCDSFEVECGTGVTASSDDYYFFEIVEFMLVRIFSRAKKSSKEIQMQ